MSRSRSGTATRTNAVRPRPMVTLTLSKEAVARLAALAEERGESRSAIVDSLILSA